MIVSCVRVLGVALLSASLVACPKKGPGAGGTDAFDARKLVPADAMAVLSVDAPTVMARPGIVRDSGLVAELSAKIKSGLGVDPSLLRDTLVFVAPMREGEAPNRGAALVPQVLKGAPGLAPLGAADVHAGQPIYKLGTSATVTFFAQGTALGDAESVRNAIDASRGKVATLAAGDPLFAVLDGLHPAPLRLAIPVKSMAALVSGLSIPGLQKITTAGLSADFTDKDIVLRGLALTTDPNGLATALRGLVQSLVGKLEQSTLFKVFGQILAGVEITPSADRVSVGVKVPLELVRGLLPMALGSVGM